jgi:hypothetical protein
LVRHGPEPVTCGNADVFRALPPACPGSRTPAAEAQLSGGTSRRPPGRCPARRPLLFRQYPQLHDGSRNSGRYPGAAGQPARLATTVTGRLPSRPTAAVIKAWRRWRDAPPGPRRKTPRRPARHQAAMPGWWLWWWEYHPGWRC